MLAEIIALLAALFFGLNLVTSRRGLISGHVYTGVLISMVTGIPMFLLFSIIVQELYKATITLSAITVLSLAGILHFSIGRSLLYKGIHLVGSNISGPIIASSALYVVLLSILILGERPTTYDILGTISIVIGLTLITMRGARIVKSYRGLIYAFAASIIFSITTILVKVGITSLNTPILATAISYTAALPPYLVLLIHSKFRSELFNTDYKILKYLTLAALTVNIAQLLRYISLSIGDASSVTPITNISPLFGIILSYIFNRSIEDFNIKIIIGAILVVTGVALITLL